MPSWWNELPKRLPPVSISLGGVPVASYFSGRLSKTRKWEGPRLLSNYCPWTWAWSLWDFAFALLERILCFLQPSGSPVCKHSGFQSQMFGCLSSQCRTSGWRAWCKVWIPCFLGRTTAIVIIILFMGCLPGGFGLDYTMSVPLQPILLWFLPYIFICRKSFFC